MPGPRPHDDAGSGRLDDRRARVALVVAIVLLLGSTMFLGVTLWSQTRALETSVSVTEDIVDANVRTLGQVQREILRLRSIVGEEPVDRAELDLHRGFVGQRMREVSLPYQLQTLGSQELLDEAQELAEVWADDIEPAVSAIVVGTPDADPSRVALLLEGLELRFNDLASRAEINRKSNAGQANSATIEQLGDARRMLVGLGVVLAGSLVFSALAFLGWRRFDRQRADAGNRLVALNRDLRKLSLVASATDNMVVITDAQGRIEWVNDAFTRVTEFTVEESVGKEPGELLQGPDSDPAVVAEMAAALTAGDGFNVEILNYTRSGQPYWVAVEVQPVLDDAGAVTNFIAVERDITERKRDEEELRRAKESAEETAREKADFLASMSHEIRTPLNAVIGLTGMLLDTQLSSEQRHYAETARNSGNLLLGLINNVLNFSAMESGQLELESRPFDVRALLRDTIALFAEDAGARSLDLRWEVDEDVAPSLVGDETRIRQIIVNLIANGLKFTPTGSVVVRARALGAATDRQAVRFEVADTGIGIPSDRLARLFRPFSQVDASTSRKYGGTGLGLAICQQLATALGGAIDVDSEVGRGTTFSLDLDLEVSTASEVVMPSGDTVAALPPGQARSLRVLLVEDDPVNQLVAMHLLERLGHVTDVAGNGIEGIEALRRRSYDVVLMDVHMPEMDGLTATQLIREEWGPGAHPPIVALTANALEGDRERFLAAGMDGYISKPVRLEELATTLAGVGTTSAATREPEPESTRPSGPIDTAAFAALHGDEHTDLLGDLLLLFLDNARGLMRSLDEAVAARDAAQVAQIAHRLTGSSRYVAAEGFADTCRDLELSARRHDLDQAATTVADLHRQFDQIDEWARVEVFTSGR